MPVAKGSTLDPDATRQRILDAASSLFLARGVHAVGISDVTKEAHASKLSLYKFFPSKGALVGAVMVERSHRVHRWLRQDNSARNSVGPESVLAVFDRLAEWYLEADFNGCAVVNTVVDTRGDADDVVRAASEQHLSLYRDLLYDNLRWLEATEPDKQRLVGQLLALIEGATVINMMDRPGTARTIRDVRAAAEVLIDYATPRGERC